jgi:glutamine synthetase
MKTNSVSFKDLLQIINDFRKENNDRFDKIEKIFANHCKEQNEMIDRYLAEREKFQKEINERFKPLEKLADRALFLVLIVSGIIAAGWQLVMGWIKKEFKI